MYLHWGFNLTFSAKSAAMTCPFLSRLPSQVIKRKKVLKQILNSWIQLFFLKNPFSSLWRTTPASYWRLTGNTVQLSVRSVRNKLNLNKISNPHIQGASQTLASPGPLARDPSLCQEGAAQVAIELCFSAICCWEIFCLCSRECQNVQWEGLPSIPRALVLAPWDR